MVDLASTAGVDATTLSRNVRHLERRCLLSAEGGRGRGGKRLTLTGAGRQLVARGLPLWDRAKAELSSRLGDGKLEAVRLAMAELAWAAEASALGTDDREEQVRRI